MINLFAPTGACRNFSRGDQNQHFAYPFQVAGDETQMDVPKTLYPFYITNKTASATSKVANCVSSKKF